MAFMGSSSEQHREGCEAACSLTRRGQRPGGGSDVRVLLVGQALGVSRVAIYLSALARCFPGKGGGDKVPSRAMLTSCRPHHLREFELLGIRRLAEAVGGTYWRDGVVYVPLPHPSGASTWLNVPENRGRLLRAVLGDLVAAGRIGGSDA
jgi:uracil-DNA glycosylase